MKQAVRPAGAAPGSWAGDHAISIPCVCGQRYDSPRGTLHKCPRCKRTWDTMECVAMKGDAVARLKANVKDAWARRDREYPPIPDLKTPWPCGSVPYDPMGLTAE
jgi:hypothetical protein